MFGAFCSLLFSLRSGNDVIFGDIGRVIWNDNGVNSNITVAQVGNGGYGDFKDGVRRTIYAAFSRIVDVGSNDTIVTGNGDNVAIGGVEGDVVTGGDARDILVRFYCGCTEW